ncbi:MAG: helix-turn-helix domain-containing protein [Candidatus Eisenbacteria bacterium]|nr:helix-turn-helix domain-containing protein [Candidatus Eisenbacteria bacterium]MBU1947432.1 helix-turn-helix domain-containing protein [Candidatus Eisenbacteria bacterium]
MELSHDICYRALRTRDARFDGRFFTGVTSTGVYCRPICPARTPQASHCTFFACAAAAEEAGFRPCRRCRPETAPGTPAWRGTSVTVSRALRLIEDGALDDAGVEDLAGRLGMGDRHLRRLFAEHLGASPLAIAQTRRVHFAKRMIEETTLSMTRIAFAAGYQNVRRFNAAIRQSFDSTPSEIRGRIHTAGSSGSSSSRKGTVALRLSYREPFDWNGLLDWMRPRAIPGVEQVEGRVYRRSVSMDPFHGVIELEPAPRKAAALILRAPVEAAPILLPMADRARALCDLSADPTLIMTQLSADPLLADAADRYPGLRVPGCWDRFELAVRAVLGQQVTVAGATRLAGKLVSRFGLSHARLYKGQDVPARSPGYPCRFFPHPEDLADADIAAIGMPAARARTIRTLARALCDGEPILELAPDLDTAIERLTALPGIGDWTAQYIAMRALREPDAFPAGDLGLQKALASAFDRAGDRSAGQRPSIVSLRERAEVWRPWRAYAAMLLWRTLTPPPRKDPQ